MYEAIYTTAIDVNENTGKYTDNKKTIIPSISEDLSNTSSAEPPYTIANTILEVFSEVTKTIENLTNKTVQEQALNVIHQIYHCLQNSATTSHRLQKLSAVQDEDESCLIEWHFTKFYIGFSLEPCKKDSYYFLVSTDELVNGIETKTRGINGELDMIVNYIVQFVMNNS